MTKPGAWLLLHGTPLTPAVWDGIRPTLEATRPVIAPLLPTPSSPEGAQGDLADRVIAAIDEAAGPLHVVGHSFGGQVALEVALRHASRVASLTVLCSRASPFPAFAPAAASLRAGTPVDAASSIGRWFLPAEVTADGPVVRYARTCIEDASLTVWADELDAIATYDRRAALRSIAAPTRIIAAAFDHVGTPEEMSAMASALPHAVYIEVPDASHMSQFLHPKELAARITGTD